MARRVGGARAEPSAVSADVSIGRGVPAEPSSAGPVPLSAINPLLSRSRKLECKALLVFER
jgi:hypothetical protein